MWGEAHQLAVGTYEATKAFPRSEVFGMTSQMRRAAVSIAANIAEGAGRGSQREFARFIRIASGSAAELHALTLLATDVELLDDATGRALDRQVTDVKKMLHGLEATLTTRSI